MGQDAQTIWAVDAQQLDETHHLTTWVLNQRDRLFPQGKLRRVLFVHPPDSVACDFDLACAQSKRYFNYPPYGLGVLASHLQTLSIEVDILNLNHEVLRAAHAHTGSALFNPETVIDNLLEETLTQFKPDLIGISCLFSVAHESAVDLIGRIRALAPTLPLALGGVHVTNAFCDNDTQARILADFNQADLLFLYEADLSLPRFVEVMQQQRPVTDLFQVVFLNQQHVMHLTGIQRPDQTELDVIPNHRLMQTSSLSRYGGIGAFWSSTPAGTKISTVLSNRGCRGRCSFCSVRGFCGKGVRSRSVDSVIEELSYLKHDFGISHVMWLDDDFLFDPARKLRLFEEMIQQKLGLTWDLTNGVVASSCKENIIQAAAESGCIGLAIGVESGNANILKAIHKPGTIHHFRQCADVLHQHESIHARVNLMIGFPNETFRMIQDTIQLAREMDLDWYNIHNLQPLPNTQVFEQVTQGDDPNFEQLSVMGSSFNKQEGIITQAGDILGVHFEDVFERRDLDQVPSPSELTRVWAYMMYELNYKHLFKEKRPNKIQQAMGYIERLAHDVVPKSAIAWYLLQRLQAKAYGKVSPDVHTKVTALLEDSPLWQQRFSELNIHDYAFCGDA